MAHAEAETLLALAAGASLLAYYVLNARVSVDYHLTRSGHRLLRSVHAASLGVLWIALIANARFCVGCYLGAGPC